MCSLDISHNICSGEDQLFSNALNSLLKQEQELVHLNLEMCRISPTHANSFAHSYNLHSHKMIGLHMAGNSNYYLNPHGYLLTQDPLKEHSLTNKNTINNHKFRIKGKS
jgi:hypothetical protein